MSDSIVRPTYSVEFSTSVVACYYESKLRWWERVREDCYKIFGKTPKFLLGSVAIFKNGVFDQCSCESGAMSPPDSPVIRQVTFPNGMTVSEHKNGVFSVFMAGGGFLYCTSTPAAEAPAPCPKAHQGPADPRPAPCPRAHQPGDSNDGDKPIVIPPRRP